MNVLVLSHRVARKRALRCVNFHAIVGGGGVTKNLEEETENGNVNCFLLYYWCREEMNVLNDRFSSSVKRCDPNVFKLKDSNPLIQSCRAGQKYMFWVNSQMELQQFLRVGEEEGSWQRL